MELNLTSLKSCKVETASMINADDTDDVTKILEKPEMRVIQFTSVYEKNLTIFKIISEIKKKATQYDDLYSKNLKEQKDLLLKSIENNEMDLNPTICSNEVESPFRTLRKECSDLENIIEELGLWSFSMAFQNSIKVIRKAFSSCDDRINMVDIDSMIESMNCIFNIEVRKLISEEDELECEKTLDLSSEKLNCLLEIFREKTQIMIFIRLYSSNGNQLHFIWTWFYKRFVN